MKFLPYILILFSLACQRVHEGKPVLEEARFIIHDAATLQQANDSLFAAGTILEIQGTVYGSLVLTESGTLEDPIRIEGGTLVSDSNGVLLYNSGHIVVYGLTVLGTTGKGTGIGLYSDDSKRYSDIRIEDCVVRGFHTGIGSSLPWESEAAAMAYPGGWDRVQVTNCSTDSAAYTGIGMYGSWPGLQNRDITVEKCTTTNTLGVSGMRPHSGHGIVVANVIEALIDSCYAYNNGWKYGHGNIGIWTHDARYVTIQNSRSVFNKSISGIDGGGFDIDGGASDCVIQNCYSEGNNGAGYLLFEYGSPNPFTRNSAVNNVSIRDGVKNQYSAFSVGGMVPVPGELLIHGNRAELLPGKVPITYFGHWPSNMTVTNNSWQ